MVEARVKDTTDAPPRDFYLRFWVFAHLLAVVLCYALSLSDRGLLINHDVSRRLFPILEVLVYPAIAAWFVCPIAVGIVLTRRRVSDQSRVIALFAEFMLCIAQCAGLLPAFQ